MRQAYVYGSELGAEREKSRAAEEARKKFERRSCKHMRSHDDQGRQLVTTENGYAYHWEGSPAIRVGDTVVLPPSHSSILGYREPWESKIVALETDYQGPTSPVMWVGTLAEFEEAYKGDFSPMALT